MKIPLLDLKKQIKPIRKELDKAIKQAIDNTNFILGKAVSEFEDKAAGYCGARYAVGVSNGTDAIRLSLAALGIKQGDKVICPAFTYYATAGAVLAQGAIPVFADIDPDTYNIAAGQLEERIKKNRSKLKAIIPVHLFGQCADMGPILKTAKKYGLKVIEDTAQAFGAKYQGRKAGSIGDCGAVSFFPGKNLGAFGDAGIVLARDKNTADKIRILRNQGNEEKYYHILAGHNNRLDALQAAVLSVKLKYLDSWNKKRAENARYFNQQLSGLSVKTPFAAPYSTHIYHQYVLRVDNSRDKLIKYLQKKGIDSRVYYPVPLHLQPCFKPLGYKKGVFPESERAACQTFVIPVHPDLTKIHMDYIISAIKEFKGIGC